MKKFETLTRFARFFNCCTSSKSNDTNTEDMDAIWSTDDPYQPTNTHHNAEGTSSKKPPILSKKLHNTSSLTMSEIKLELEELPNPRDTETDVKNKNTGGNKIVHWSSTLTLNSKVSNKDNENSMEEVLLSSSPTTFL